MASKKIKKTKGLFISPPILVSIIFMLDLSMNDGTFSQIKQLLQASL